LKLRDAERRIYDLLATSIRRVLPVSRWLYESTEVQLPFLKLSEPGRIHRFEAEIEVPDSGYRWFLKMLMSGNARVVVDGETSYGYDEAHTYVPLRPGRHRVEVYASPRTMFGFHMWRISFDYAYLVEVSWRVASTALRMLQLIDFAEKLRESDPLREELEDAVKTAVSKISVAPSVGQIAASVILLYATPLQVYFRRGDLRGPYSDYLWLTGVYGLGVLQGLLSDTPRASVEEAEKQACEAWMVLSERLNEVWRRYPKMGVVYAVGHSHIDAEWLWPREETVEKVLRTFSTVVRLMEEYPGFTYIQSSAQYYRWVEERDPKLFEEIRRLVAEGRWIIAGGMWVESDTQLVDGESLARQFLYGQRYFMSRFGRIARIGWIPDSFGFSGNLPQIMRKSGIEVFLTHKVMWNDTNEFPHHSFVWRGIDGTEIPVQILINSYNETMTPWSIASNWARYKDKEVPFIPYSYGYGDGGGGPTREMLEYVELNRALPGIPDVVFLRESEYVEKVKESLDKFKSWSGELYVEIHRGTYTTNLKMKELMARAEAALYEAELWSTVAYIAGRAPNRKSEVDELWRRILFNQFHDIIPGSSIREVYENTYRDLEDALKKLGEIAYDSMRALLGSGEGVAIFNPLPWSRSGVIKVPRDLTLEGAECQEVVDGIYVYVSAPPAGFKVYRRGVCRQPSSVVEVAEGGDLIILRNEYLEAAVDSGGNLASLKLGESGEEVLAAPSNRLIAHIDKPGIFDAWDVTDEFLEDGEELEVLEKPRVSVRGPLAACVEYVKGFKSSRIRQRLCIYKGSPVIEVWNRIEWNDKNVLVKAWFEVNAKTDRAFYSIPFGTVERSTKRETSWEKARFEVPALRWADLSDGHRGLAIIAPSRHGYSAVGSRVGLSLIRSPVFPNPWSDLGVLETYYYIYPHRGGYLEAEVPRIAEELIHRLKAVEGGAPGREESFVTVEPPKALFSAVKLPEDSLKGLVVRLYNPYNAPVEVGLKLALPVKSVVEMNILETEKIQDVDISRINLKPFEIKTLVMML